MYARFYSQESPLNEKEKLTQLLKINFPINNTQTSDMCWLYPFSNEDGFSEVLHALKNIEPMVTNKIKTAILFGESNFLSILPELSQHADLIIMADVEFRIHRHNQYLLDYMASSQNPEEFKSNYANQDNPLINEPFYQYGSNCKATKQILNDHFTHAQSWKSLGDFHFLHNEERFIQCKKALEKISLVRINIDLTIKEKCEKLADLLNDHNATITLCNFTNIHDYPAYAMSLFAFSPEPSGPYLYESTLALLKHSQACLTMYAITKKSNNPDTIKNGLTVTYVGEPKTHLSLGLHNYQNNALRHQHYRREIDTPTPSHS